MAERLTTIREIRRFQVRPLGGSSDLFFFLPLLYVAILLELQPIYALHSAMHLSAESHYHLRI